MLRVEPLRTVHTSRARPWKALQGVKVDLHVRDASVSENHTAVGRARLYADLGQSLGARRTPGERLVEAVHVGHELFHRRVLGTDFADLAADRDIHALRLQLAHRQRQLHSLLVIRALLLLERRLGEIDQGRSIDIDVVEARRDRFARELFHTVHLGDGINRKLLDADLEVIALNEDRSAKAFAERGGKHHRDILRRPLIRVGDLRPRDFLDERSDLESDGGAEDRTRRVVGHSTNVHRGNGEAAAFAFPARKVQVVNRRRLNAHGLPDFPDHPARVLAIVGFAENRGIHEFVHRGRCDGRFVVNGHPSVHN